MNVITSILTWLREKDNQDLLRLLGGALAALAGAGGWLYLNGFLRRKPKSVAVHQTLLTFRPSHYADGSRVEDVAFAVAERLAALPRPADETLLFREAANLFQRPAFYDHPEKAWDTGLWAIIVTRLLWEQQVMSRATDEQRTRANAVVRALLDLEDLQARIVGVPPEIMDRLVSRWIGDKAAFLENLRQATVTHRGKNVWTLMRQRRPLLDRLQAALASVGVNAPLMGKYEFSPRE